MLRRGFVLCILTAAVSVSAPQARAGGPVVVPCATPCNHVHARPCGHAHAGPCGSSVHYVQKTVLVPQYGTETRVVNCTEYQNQIRERKYTVHRRVPETKQVEQQYTEIVCETRSKKVKYNVSIPVTETVQQKYQVQVPEWIEVERPYQVQVPVWKEVEQKYTELVPHQEQRKGVRKVYQTIAVQEKRLVCRDAGHFEERAVAVPVCNSGCRRRGCARCCRPCGGCGGCASGTPCHAPKQAVTICRVWVPNVVQEEVEVTVNKCVTVDQPYEYTVTVCKPVEKTRTVKVCEYVTETKTRKERQCRYRTEERTRDVKVCSYKTEEREKEVKYIVQVPHKKTRTVDVTTYTTVAEEKTEQYTVCVPVTVQKEVQVPVCHMVPKTITVPVRTGCGCAPVKRCRKCGC